MRGWLAMVVLTVGCSVGGAPGRDAHELGGDAALEIDAGAPVADAAIGEPECTHDSACPGLDGPEVCYLGRCIEWRPCRAGDECNVGACMAYDGAPCPAGELNCVCVE